MGHKDEINEPVSGTVVSTQVSPQVSRKGLADAELDRAAGEPSNHHYHYSNCHDHDHHHDDNPQVNPPNARKIQIHNLAAGTTYEFQVT